MVGNQDHGPLLDRHCDPLRDRLCPVLPRLHVLPALSRRLDPWADWLVRTRFAGSSDEDVARQLAELARTRDTILDNARLRPGDTVVDVGAGTGLLTIGALERIGEDGTVLAVDPSIDALEDLRRHVTRGGVYYLLGNARVLPMPDEYADAALVGSALMSAELAEVASELRRVLRRRGRLSIFEPLDKYSTSIYDTVDWPGELRDRMRAEGDAYMSGDGGLVGLDESELEQHLSRAGFAAVDLDLRERWEEWTVTPENVELRLDAVPAVGEPSLRRRWQATFDAKEVERLVAHLKGLVGATLKFKRVSLFVSAVRP